MYCKSDRKEGDEKMKKGRDTLSELTERGAEVMERLGRKAIQTAKQQAVKTYRRHKEDERTVKVTVRMPEDLVKALKHKAIDEGKTFQDLVTEAVRKFLGR